MSNGIASVDVGALDDFIAELRRFSSELQTSWGRLNGRWRQSSESWRDIKRDQFEGAVGWDAEVVRTMETYLGTSDKYEKFLRRLSAAAHDYLNS